MELLNAVKSIADNNCERCHNYVVPTKSECETGVEKKKKLFLLGNKTEVCVCKSVCVCVRARAPACVCACVCVLRPAVHRCFETSLNIFPFLSRIGMHEYF